MIPGSVLIVELLFIQIRVKGGVETTALDNHRDMCRTSVLGFLTAE
jgi:hypothetical protein